MIIDDSAKVRDTITEDVVLELTYRPLSYEKMVVQHLSTAAQAALQELCPHEIGRYIPLNRPEIIALRLLDFLSSKQGYIRRKGHTFRTKSYYLHVLPTMLHAIRTGQTITLDSLCLCTTLGNVKYAGESPYPHMAAYIAFENVHKIAKAAREIYPPGIKLVLGYEGTLLRSLYFHSETVVSHSLAILKQLNGIAYRNIIGEGEPNPVEIVDAVWMIERTFGTYNRFLEEVEQYKQSLPTHTMMEWQDWYSETVSTYYFPSNTARQNFIIEQAKWRAAVHHFKYEGGMLGKGFMQFDDSVIPFTPSGRRSNMLALQLIPRSSYLPHQRVIVYDEVNDQWSMQAYQDIQQATTVYARRYIREYLYPFYFKKLRQSSAISA